MEIGLVLNRWLVFEQRERSTKERHCIDMKQNNPKLKREEDSCMLA